MKRLLCSQYCNFRVVSILKEYPFALDQFIQGLGDHENNAWTCCRLSERNYSELILFSIQITTRKTMSKYSTLTETPSFIRNSLSLLPLRVFLLFFLLPIFVLFSPGAHSIFSLLILFSRSLYPLQGCGSSAEGSTMLSCLEAFWRSNVPYLHAASSLLVRTC